MWIKTEDDKLINLDFIKEIYIGNTKTCGRFVYTLIADISDNESYTIIRSQDKVLVSEKFARLTKQLTNEK